MKRLTDWLFAYYKNSPATQGAIAGLVIAHIGVLGGFSIVWLVNWLPWPK